MSTERIYQPGDILIKEGDFGNEAYLIREGSVTVSALQGDKPLILATIGAGEIVGEMALVDEKPRSATVTAASRCRIEVIHRDHFLRILQNDGELAIELLRVLFERLRNTQRAVLGHKTAATTPAETTTSEAVSSDTPVLRLTGMTPHAKRILPEGGLVISQFPFRIGRKSQDPLTANDLSITDYPPFQISRNHAAFIMDSGRPAIIDRGSHLGLEINGAVLGGYDGGDGFEYLQDKDNELCLGSEHSDYWFKVDIL